MKKEDLVEALDARLKANPSAYSKLPGLQDYYSHRANSPVKREPSQSTTAAAASSTTAADPAPKTNQSKPRRRQTNVASSSADSLLPSGTPQSIQRVASTIPLPSSPQHVTNFVERQSALVTRRAGKLIQDSRVPGMAQSTRVNLSSPHGISTMFLAVEGLSLLRKTLPMRHAFSFALPFAAAIGLKSPVAVYFPDFFVLLTASFWSPTMLWLLLSVFAPLAVGWTCNLTRVSGVHRHHRYTIDPVASNVAKGVGAWLIFVQKFGIPSLFNPRTVGAVEGAILGGVPEMEISAAIGAFAGLYEAVLKK